MKTLIAGMGEIGSALSEVLGEEHVVERADVDYRPSEGKMDVLNICFPWSDAFFEDVVEFQAYYSPTLTIIHSTVPIGTTRQVSNAVHSPCIGRHPDLAESIRTFRKPIAGIDRRMVGIAEDFFGQAGIRTSIFSKPEATEAAKLFSTLRLGWDIMYQREVADFCERKGVRFDEVYTLWTEIYNEGYKQIDGRFVRPNLFLSSGPIGGHCVIPNARLLEEWEDFELARQVVEFDEEEREG